MRALGCLLALVGALAAAPAAGADTFAVDDPGDAPDLVPGDGDCDTDGGGDRTPCTLRAAIDESNAAADTDTVDLSAVNGPILVATTLEVGTGAACVPGTPCPVTIADDGGAEVRFTGAVGPLLRFAPDGFGSHLSGVRLSADPASSGALLRIEASGFALTGGSVSGARGDGIQIAGSAASVGLTSPAVSGSAGDGVRIEAGASNVSLNGGSVTSSGGDGIDVAGSNVTLSGTRVSGSAEQGVNVATSGRNVVITRSPVFSNTLEPIFLAAGANSDIPAPGDMRIGPRRADGSLPLTGSTATGGGTVEVFLGDPTGPAEISFLGDAAAGPGGFSFLPPSEQAPGTVFAATLRDSRGTSEFARAVVPADVVSPVLAGAVATSLTEVRVQAAEPLDPASVQPEDFALDMAGQRRAIESASLSADRSEIVLRSSGWTHGEAGFVELGGAGAIADAAGNASLAGARLRVRAAPGDLLGPVASSLAIRPRRFCLRRGRGCRRTGARVTFLSTEGGRARLVIMRGNRRIGVDDALAVAGRNTVRFSGKLGNRRLRPGRYRMLLYVEDEVGNELSEPPIQLFTVKRPRRR